MSDIKLVHKPTFKFYPNDPAYRVWHLKDGYYSELIVLRYKDLVSIDMSHKLVISTDKDVELKLTNIDTFTKIYNRSLEAPLIIERLIDGFEHDPSTTRTAKGVTSPKASVNVMHYVTAVQQHSAMDDAGVVKDEYIVQGLSLLSLLQFKLWPNNKYYANLPVDDNGDIQKPDNYMYYLNNSKDKIETIIGVLNNVLASGEVPNGRRKTYSNNTIVKGGGGAFRHNPKPTEALPGEYNFECGSVNIADKMTSACNDFNYGFAFTKKTDDGGTLDKDGFQLSHWVRRDKPVLFSTIDWRYSNQKPVSLTMTHDFHSTTSGVYITDDACNDKFYSKIKNYMPCSFDVKSENSDSSDTLDQAKDLINENLSKIDKVEFEYNELDVAPFTELTLGNYIKYILDGYENIYVITGLQETIEGNERNITYTLSLADEDIANSINK